jgi:hypothetical protein
MGPAAGHPYSQVQRRKDIEMIIMTRNKKWSDLTARQKAPFVLRGTVQFALLAAALADIYRRPAEEIRGSKWLWSAVAFANSMGIGSIAYFLFGRKRA